MGPAPKCHFVLGFPSWSTEIPEIETLTTLGAYNFACKPLIEVRSKEKLYPLLRAFQWRVACHLHTRKSGRFITFNGQESNCQFDSQPPFFGHNLCFKYPNGSCESSLDIYVLKAFHCYKKTFNPMSFDPCNLLLKIWESIGTPTPKMGAHLGVLGFIPSHFPALSGAWNVIPGLTLGPHLCKPLLWSQAQGVGLQHKQCVPKVGVFMAIVLVGA
jgi:hypothetical protein